MKKLLAIFVVLVFWGNVNAQNIGIMLGGGLATMKYNTDKDDFNSLLNDSTDFINIYHVGFNFENTLIPKQFYLQFSLQAMGKGFTTFNEKQYMKMHFIHIPVELKYKFRFNDDYNFYLSAGPYIAFKLTGKQYDEVLKTLAETNPDIEYSEDIKFGKTEDDDIFPIDYGLNLGAGFGLSNIQIGYNFGYGLANVSTISDQTLNLQGFNNFVWSHSYHSVTLAYYFTKH